ncbi:MAG: DJ-1/PfpI family protein [Myxococcales bacterium]|nr:DJ-1/PfpI family protein [Myxococcales bacterium]
MALARILVPLPDRDFDVTEVSVPWRLWTRRGFDVVFATEGGDEAAADPLLLSGVIFGQLGAEREAKVFYRELLTASSFKKPLRFRDIDPADFDALHLPGGHAKGMRPYLESTTLREKVLELWRLRRSTSAICHGVIVLARTTIPETGRSVLFDRRTTCLPKYMERSAWLSTAWKLGDYYRTYPEYVEDEVRRALAHPEQFIRGPIHLFAKGTNDDDSAAFVVDDGHYLSARWPGDAYKLARVFSDKVLARKTGASSFRGTREPASGGAP